jgi:carbon-monoxide dehydrogenase medium subunit
MLPAPFSYHRPATVDEALSLLAQNGDAKILAGGHSLLPAMKLRLAQPAALIDLGRVTDLSYIREADGRIAIGAMTTHFDIESSELLREKCPLLTALAPMIGDVQVRNRGTFGGSLVHADPAADWPAAVLALDAELEIAGPNGRRTVKATEFFVDMMQSAVQPNEILCEIRVPVTAKFVAYVKTAQKASGFAIAGVAVVLNKEGRSVSIGVTGVSAKPFRAQAVENELRSQDLTPENIRRAATKTAEGIEPLSDIHASAEFRAHLAEVNCRRALARANEVS